MKVAGYLSNLLVLLIACCSNVVFAHLPHDDNRFIALSPNYGTDATAFVTQKQGHNFRPHVALVTRDGGYSWEYNPAGMNNTSLFNSAAVSPLFAFDNKVFMTSQSEGVYYSSDAGTTWSQINQGLPAINLRDSATGLDPDSAVQLYVSGADGGLYRTGDSGATWETVLDSTVFAAEFALSPDYTVDGTIIVGDNTGTIYISTDGGASFTQNNNLQGVGNITRIGFTPDFASSGEIIVATTVGLYRSLDSGQTYTQIQSFASERVYALSVSPNYRFDGTIFAATATSVFRSADAGASWSTTATDIQLSGQSSEHFFDLQVSENFTNDGIIYLAAFEGLFISSDGGLDWDELDTRPATLVMDVAMSPDYQQDGLILASTYGGGLYITDDAGLNWRVSNTGVSNTYTYQVKIRQGTGMTPVMIATQINHVLISTDLGESWTRKGITGVLPRDCIPSSMDVSRTYATDQSILLGCHSQGVVLTQDGGNTWQLLLSEAQLNGGSITSVQFSPDFAVDSTMYFVDIRGYFIRSNDAGNTWSVINSGLPVPSSWFGGTAISLSDNFAIDNVAAAATPKGLYASVDRGNSWGLLTLDPSSPVATGIIESTAVSPDLSNDRTVLASVRGQGLFRTIDGGQSWQAVGSGLLDQNNELKGFVFSPNHAVDGEIVGFGHDRILRSTDRGLSFQAMDIPFIRHEDERNQSVGYTGTWQKFTWEPASGTTGRATQTVGNEVSLSFVGTGISWIGVKASMLGVAEVYLDDVLVSTVDQYSPALLWQEELFSLQGLPLGLHEIRVRVTDTANPGSSGNWTIIDAFDAWKVTASPVNTPPAVTNPGNQSNTVGDSGVSLEIVASDPDGDALSYSASGLPASLGINAGTGLVSGDISAAAGSFNVTVTVTDDGTPAAEATSVNFTWTVTAPPVNTPPAVTNPGNQSNTVGDSGISLQIVASDADDDNLSYSASGLPASLGINAGTGLVSGDISAAAGSFNVTVTVTDDGTPAAEATSVNFTWTVTASPVNTPPAVANPGNQSNTVGDSGVSLQIVASDPDDDNLSYSASGLPASLGINAGTGLVSGDISAAAGSFNVTVTVTDDGTPAAEATSVNFTWTVTASPLNTPPAVTNPGNQSNTVGDSGISLQIVASDPDDDNLSYSASGLPASLGINAGTGLVSGDISAAAGSFNVTVTVTDDGTPAAEATSINFTWTVTASPGLPSLSIASVQASEGDAGIATMTFTVRLSSPSNDVVSVRFDTGDGSATAGLDYVTASDQLSFSAGDTSRSIAVDINGDTDVEASETLIVNLSAAQNATLATASATGTILNDDFISGLPGIDNRPDNQTCIAPPRPSTNASVAVIDPFPGLPDIEQPTKMLLEPVANPRWFVLQKEGQMVTFDPDDATSLNVYGDLSGWLRTERAGGLLGMAFHPDYPATPEIFLYYTIPHTGPAMRSEISRFILDNIANPGAGTVKQVILQVDQDFDNHNGGDIAFGADGYLYLGLGDGGSGGGQTGDPNNRAQDTTNMLGSMLRIDVDGPGVSFPANPYEIPPDNPFAGENKCLPGLNTHPCPEIYAWGFRNPYRWSFDDDTGQLWVGDVGELAYEEIDVVENGGNYGWRCREGAHDFKPNGCGSGLIDPVFEYPRGQGSSLTGGYVYRGSAIPELVGRYVFADFVSGQIWALQSDGQGGYISDQLIDTNFGATSFGVDADGELYITDLNNSRLRMLVPAGPPVADTIPELLSDSGCTDPADVKLPYAGLMPYDINALFWSDGAAKERFIALPNGSTITRGGNDDWQFPNGTVIVKNFRLNGNLVETRHLMRHPDGVWAGYTYEWDAQQSEARRVRGGKTVISNGQPWIFPSESECMACHTATADFALGPETAQLNRTLVYPSTGRTAHQMETMDNLLMFTAPLPPVSSLPRLTIPADTAATIDDRARAYLHTNCSQCHRPGGPTPASMDLRYDTLLSNTDACDVAPALGDLGIANARLIAPGDALRSIIVRRMMRRDSHGMPPLGSAQIDDDGIDLLSDWITGLGSCIP